MISPRYTSSDCRRPVAEGARVLADSEVGGTADRAGAVMLLMEGVVSRGEVCRAAGERRCGLRLIYGRENVRRHGFFLIEALSSRRLRSKSWVGQVVDLTRRGGERRLLQPTRGQLAARCAPNAPTLMRAFDWSV